MPKKIVAFEFPLGSHSFPTVGMNDRYVSNLKTKRGIHNETMKSCHAKNGRKYQVRDFDTDKILFEGETKCQM